jgi:hypothetical protein
MKRFLTIALLVLASLTAYAQDKAIPPQPALSVPGADTMKKLAFLDGKWTGSGWIMLGPQQREEFNQTEWIHLKLNGSIVEIEGEGRSKTDNHPVHNAFGVIYFDQQANEPRFHAFLADGKNIIANMKVSDDGFIWGFKVPNLEIRYTMTHTANNDWLEFGERSTDGKTWTKYYEMKLTKDR